MKKKVVIILSILIICIVMIGILFFIKNDDNNINYTNDEIKFKDEYENMNGLELTKDYILKSVNINIDNNVKYVNDDEILNLLKEGTNVIYLGWPDCNWCRSIVPTLIDVIKEENIEKLYYYNFKSLRNGFENNEEDKVKLYENILDIIGEKIESVFDENSSKSGEKKILAPTVIFIKDGNFSSLHVKSVDSHISSTDELTTTQIKELKSIYKNHIKELKTYTCDEGC